jgi:8-oxo-dGTP pyrophosphatase MutT (NUDIX family)
MSAPHRGDQEVNTALPAELPSLDPRPAAVLCAVFDDGGQASVVLTRRSAQLRSHTGEVSFPGGRLEPGESAFDAARREAWEEVGIDPGSVELIGWLRPLTTANSRSMIEPVVGVVDPPPVLRPNPAEVELAFTTPLRDLLSPGVYHDELWRFPGRGEERVVHFFALESDIVWGATARMLWDLLDRVWALGVTGQSL